MGIEAEQVQTEMYIWSELVFSEELESELKQAVSSQSVELFSTLADRPSAKPSVPDVNPELVRRFGELLVRRREEIALENSPAVSKLAAKRRRSELEEGLLSAPPVEKMQEPVQRQEQSKQRQKRRVKKCDQGMEL